jgi:hypothetical protein
MEIFILLIPALYIGTIVFVLMLLWRMTSAVERIANHLERRG